MAASETQRVPENWQSISDVGWLGKEHFESFQDMHARLFTKSLASIAYNACIQGGGKRVFATEPTSYGGRRITGFEQFTPRSGLTVAERSQVGLGAYPNELREYPNLTTVCRQYAIEAYGFVATIEDERAAQLAENVPRVLSDVFLHAVAGSLATYLSIE